MATSTVHTAPADYTESAYAWACRLIKTELGGRHLTPEPANWDEQQEERRSFTGKCLNRALAEANTAVTDHA